MLIPLTEKCNQKCIYCGAEGRPGADTVYTEAMIKKGNDYIILSGGETTLAPRFFYWLALARQHCSFLELQSNGVLFSYKKNAEKIVQYSIDLFNIAMPSHLEEINDTITQAPNTLLPRMQGIKNLLALGQKVRISHIICKSNYKELPGYARFLKDNFPGLHLLQMSFVKAIGAATEREDIVPRYSEVEPYLNEALQVCAQNDMTVIVDHIPLCYINREFSVHVDVEKIKLENTNHFDEKTHVAACKKCRLLNICLGPRKDYIDIYGEDVVRPVIP
ncbi:MAG: radical SAM protein [bacterium]|nr:radical SAM protein [bacterium]